MGRANDLAPGNPMALSGLAAVYALSGDDTHARALLQPLLHPANGVVSPFYIATVYAALGDRDSAFGWLEQEQEEWIGHVKMFLRVLPLLDPLHSDPR